MFCTKCGTKNNDGAKFCVKCGEKFDVKILTKKEKTNENLFISYFKNLFTFVTKPITFLEEKNKLEDTGKAFAYAGIITGIMLIVNILIKLIYAGIYSIKLSTTFYKVNFVKYLSFPKLIFLDLTIYAAIIFGIAGIFTLTGVILKKKVKFTKMLSLSSLAIMPYAVGGIVFYTLFSTFSTFLALFIGSVGLIYTVILLVSIINKEFELKDNKKVYVNAIVFTVIAFFVMLYAYLVLYKGVSITFKTESTRFLFK